MTISVLFPSGAHGHFIAVLLNHSQGIKAINQANSRVFDKPQWIGVPDFDIKHQASQVPDPDRCVQISVGDSDIFKWTVMSMSRASDLDIELERAHQDPWTIFQSHPHMAPLLGSLKAISGQDHGSVPISHMRDWARLCFFDDDCRTMRQILACSNLASARVVVEFGDIYRDPMAVVSNVLSEFGLFFQCTENISQHISKFERQNRYRWIDLDLDMIFSAIDSGRRIRFDSGNFVKQAWIDNYLVKRYNVVPLLIDNYWEDTQQLMEAYGLK
jgi:hypothetical protein